MFVDERAWALHQYDFNIGGDKSKFLLAYVIWIYVLYQVHPFGCQKLWLDDVLTARSSEGPRRQLHPC